MKVDYENYFFFHHTKVDYKSFARRVCPRLIATVCS